MDNDGRSDSDFQRLQELGVYALPVFSVESIYYHPEIQRIVTKRLADVTGGDVDERTELAETAAYKKILQSISHLSERVTEKRVRTQILNQLPRKKQITSSKTFKVDLDIEALLQEESDFLYKAIRERDLMALIARYPVRETGALKEIATKLGFPDRASYEGAVRTAIMADKDTLEFVRSLFGSLPNDIDLD